MSNEANRADEQSLIVNQLIAEFMSRTDAGENLDVAQFLKEHPEHAAELEKHFANVDLLDGLKETGQQGHDETILKSDAGSEQSTDDATANTIVRGGTDSETSVTRDFERRDTEKTEVAIPENFGRYAIQKVLGQGAMGAVYLARDTQLDRDVALKIPKFDDSNGVDDEELLARFYREARASATLRSPNICPVYDVGEIDGQHYITMAFIEGRPLKDFTKSKKQHSEKQIATTIRKLAVGLAEAHEIGVIHRDLKPANIMVDLKGEPVVMDFGLARRSSSDDVQVTQSGAILGTPAYMAPEQVAGDQAAINHQVDIYALGVIMYELITGEMPFKGNLMAILQQIALNNPTKPSELRDNLDSRLEKICLKMMAGDQQQRYQSMNDVAADLQDVIKHPNRKQKKEAAQKTGPKPKAIPTAYEESNPALISVEQPKSYAEQLRKKKSKPSSKSAKSSTRLPVTSPTDSGGNKQKLLIFGGLGGLILLLGIIFLVRVGKYDVQITLDDPSITLSVDGEVLNIKDGQDVYKLSAGEHKLKLEKDGLTTHVEDFTVSKDGKTALQAAIVNGKLDGLLNGEKPVQSSSVGDMVAEPENDADQEFGLAFNTESQQLTGSRSGLQFDGTTDEPFVASLEGEAPMVELTLEAWITGQARLNGTAIVQILGSKIVSTQIVYDFFRGWRAYRYHNHAEASKRIDTAYPRDRTHVATVCSKNKLSLFVNGKLTASTPFATKPNSFKTLLIGSNQNSRNPFVGIVDEVRLSRVARYTTDFDPAERFETDDKTVALYHFDEGSGDIAKDSSGNGHHGKIDGAKWVRQEGENHLTNGPEPEFPGGLEFDGDDVVNVDSLEFDPTKPFTLEAAFSWHYKYLVTSFAVFAGRDEDASGNSRGPTAGARLTTHSHNHVTYRLGEVHIDSGDVPEKHERVHLAIVHTGEELLAFRDGKLVDRKPTVGKDLGPGTGRFLIGKGLIGRYEMLRFSTTARYDKDFWPENRFSPDSDTLALYHFDTGTGDVLKDSSGNGHHGKIIGAKWVKVDGSDFDFANSPPVRPSTTMSERTSPETSLYFSHLEDEVLIPTLKDDTDALTIELWLQRDSSHLEAHSQIVGSAMNASISTNSSRVLDFQMPGTGAGDGPGEGYDVDGVGKPIHVAGVRDPEKGEIRLYYDGKLIQQSAGEIARGNGSFKICGKEYQWNSDKKGLNLSFSGWIDEIRISKSVRYQDGFTPQRRFEKDDQTTALYHFEEGEGDVLKDSSGNGHHGKIIGAKWVRGNRKVSNVVPDPVDDTENLRWPLESSRPEDIAWLQGLGASVTLRTGPEQDVVLLADDAPPAGKSTVVGVKFDSKLYQSVTDEVLKSLAKFTDLEYLELKFDKDAPVTKEAASYLKALVQLRRLKLARFGPPDTDPSFISALPRLGDINLSYDPPYLWEEGVANSKSLQTLFLYHTFPKNWEPFSQMPRLKEVILMGRHGTDEKRNTLAKEFSKLAPWCRIVVRGFSEDENDWTIFEPTATRLNSGRSATSSLLSPAGEAPPPASVPFDEAQAKVHQKAWADHLGVPVEYENSIGMKFRLMPPGEFMMGSVPEEIEAILKVAGKDKVWKEWINSEGPQHLVILTQPVYVGMTEVSQRQYQQVMGSNPSHFSATGDGKILVANLKTGDHPVEMVSWYDAVEFCAKLSQQEKLKPFYSRSGETVTSLAGTGYRLPTEAEWESACRAGTTTQFWSGDIDQSLITTDWIESNSGGLTHAVGELKANPYGLSDMHGNVWEWVQDSGDLAFYGNFRDYAAVNPSSPFSANRLRVNRGGNFFSRPARCRSPNRIALHPARNHPHLGFRVVLQVDAVKAN